MSKELIVQKSYHLCWHKWMPWSDPVVTSNSGYKQQWRVCEKCNKAQKRTMGWDHQVNVNQVIFAVKQSRGEDQ